MKIDLVSVSGFTVGGKMVFRVTGIDEVMGAKIFAIPELKSDPLTSDDFRRADGHLVMPEFTAGNEEAQRLYFDAIADAFAYMQALTEAGMSYADARKVLPICNQTTAFFSVTITSFYEAKKRFTHKERHGDLIEFFNLLHDAIRTSI